MTNGPDEQQPGQQPPPPPPPPPSGGGRGLFSRNDPDQPAPLPPQRPQPPQDDPRRQPPPDDVRGQPPPEDPRRQPPPRDDVRSRPVSSGPEDSPFLLPNERERMPVYGAAPPLPVVPLAVIVLAIVVGLALIYMSQSDKKDTGITAQQAANSLVLHLDGVDMTEDAFRREIATGIKKGRVPCDKLAGQQPDNIAAGLKLGALKMEVPSASGVAAKNGQKADDASLLVAAQVVLDSCPKAPAQQPPQQQQQLPPQNPPGGQTNPPGGTQPAPAGTQAPPVPGGAAPAATPAGAPAGTPRPTTPSIPSIPGR